MLLARQWLWTMPLMLRSSKAIRPNLSTKLWLTWWANSYRLLAIRSWTRSTTLRAFLRSGVPLGALESFLWALANSCSSSRKNRGLDIFSPFESVAKDSRPTSMPTRVPSFQGGLGWSSISTEKHAYHFPVAARRTVSLLILPSMGLWRLILIFPIFERYSFPVVSP